MFPYPGECMFVCVCALRLPTPTKLLTTSYTRYQNVFESKAMPLLPIIYIYCFSRLDPSSALSVWLLFNGSRINISCTRNELLLTRRYECLNVQDMYIVIVTLGWVYWKFTSDINRNDSQNTIFFFASLVWHLMAVRWALK